MDISSVKIIQINTKIDIRGNLSIIEGMRDLPFEIKRIYYIWNNLDNSPRGGHAHRELYQAFIAMHGSCRLLIDDGREKKDFILNDPSSCLIMPPGLWREIYEFSNECALLILASDYYEESDYIRNYLDFVEYTGNNE